MVLMAAAPPESQAGMSFTNVTSAAGITHVHSHADVSDFWNDNLIYTSGGAVAEDFDGDGWMDLYVLQGGDSPNLLYINQQNGTFVNQAAARGAALTGAHVGATAADYDGDGDIDIFVSAAAAPHYLLVNNGPGPNIGTFTVSPQVFNLPANGATSPSWGDIDNDGLLDLALGAWNFGGAGDVKIYRNSGAGLLQSHQSLTKNYAFTQVFADLDNDRFQDLVSIADFGNASFFRNGRNGLMVPSGTSDIQNGMGGAVGDIDNDGDLDVFMTSIFDAQTSGNRMLKNNGSGVLSDFTLGIGNAECELGVGL